MSGATRVLVSGGCGFLGRYVVRRILAAEHQLVSLDLAADRDVDHCVTADLSEGPPDLSAVAPSTVYHLAGLAHLVPHNDTTRRRFFDVNVRGTRNLFLSLEEAGGLTESLVLVSTVAVYGLEEGEDFEEKTARVATDPYGESKRQAEDLALEWGDKTGVRIGIVRLPLVAGPRAPGNFGAMVTALQRGRYLGVGPGGARRSMVLARDVAQVLPRVAELGGVYHLTDGHHPSFRELEGAICGALNRPEPKRLPMPAARILGLAGDAVTAVGASFPFNSRALRKMTSTLTFSDEKARRELGWQPTRVVDAAGELVA
jgi:nucleoside-diphosphate-sugar epimerase